MGDFVRWKVWAQDLLLPDDAPEPLPQNQGVWVSCLGGYLRKRGLCFGWSTEDRREDCRTGVPCSQSQDHRKRVSTTRPFG